MRAILGQQVTVKAASTLVARVAERYGEAYECDVEGLSYTFPEPARLVEADLDGMGIVGARIAAIRRSRNNSSVASWTSGAAWTLKHLCLLFVKSRASVNGLRSI